MAIDERLRTLAAMLADAPEGGRRELVERAMAMAGCFPGEASVDETKWRLIVEQTGGDPDREIQTATYLIAALLRHKFPPTVRMTILQSVVELLGQPATALEAAIANAGEPEVADRFKRRVDRLVRNGVT